MHIDLISFLFICMTCGAYLWFVIIAGPKLMEKREPYNVKPLLRVYNISQVVVCTIIVTRTYQLGFTFEYVFKCERFEFLGDLEKSEIKLGGWLFLMLRTLEFVETVFFVLRKKEKQASFLHIFHHIGSVLMTWLFLVCHAGENGLRLCDRLATKNLFRTDGCLHCGDQLDSTHRNVHLLLLKLIQKRQCSKGFKANEALHYPHTISAVRLNNCHLYDCCFAQLQRQLILQRADLQFHRLVLSLREIFHQNLH